VTDGVRKTFSWLAAAAFALFLSAAMGQGVQEAGTAEREERSVQMSENVYRRLNAVHELLGEDDLDGAIERLDTLLEMRLSDYEEALIHQAYGFAYAQQGDYDRAIASFEMCLAVDALPNLANQGMLYSLAGLYANEGQFEKAVDTMSVWFSFAAEPVPADAYMLVGSGYAQLGQLDSALPYVQEANARGEMPNESWHMLELSIHFDPAVQDFGSAVDLLREMVVFWPQTARYWEMLASAYLELEDDPNALATLMVAYKQGMVEEGPKLLNLVRLNLFLEVPFEAGQILETALVNGQIEENEDNLELLLSAWESAREYSRAVAVIDRLAPLTGDGEYHMRKARLLSEQGDWTGVIEATELALEAGGLETTGQTLLLKGMAHAEQGDFDIALTTFNEARDFEDSARRNADAWIEYVRDRRQVVQNRP